MNTNPNPELNAQVSLLYAGFRAGGIKSSQLPRNTITLDEIWDIVMETEWWNALSQEPSIRFAFADFNKQLEKLGYRPFSLRYVRKSIWDWTYKNGWFYCPILH